MVLNNTTPVQDKLIEQMEKCGINGMDELLDIVRNLDQQLTAAIEDKDKALVKVADVTGARDLLLEQSHEFETVQQRWLDDNHTLTETVAELQRRLEEASYPDRTHEDTEPM